MIIYCFLASYECAELLLQRGANVNEKTTANPAVPLHEAASRGDFRMCEMLLSYNGDANALDKHDRAPIHLAAFEDHYESREVISFHD